MTDLAAKLRELSPDRKRLLAARLSAGDASVARDRLVAFVTPPDGQDKPDVQAMRVWLSERLPPHMVPDIIAPVSALPRLPNGKVDRRALMVQPLEETPKADADATPSEPTSEAEEILAEIWSDLLGVHPIHRDDDFFELGGDSIVAIQLVSRARQSGVWLDPADIADYPTIARLAEMRRTDNEPVDASDTKEAPALPIQLWHLTRGLQHPSHWNQSRLYRLDARVSFDMANQAIEACASVHPALRTRFESGPEGWRQVCDLGTPDLRHVRLDDADPDRFQEIATEENAAMDLGGPLARFVFVDTPESNRYLLMVLHHLVVDAVSWFLLAEDVDVAVKDLLSGRAPKLASATSPLQMAEQLSDYAGSKKHARDVSPWRHVPAPDAFLLPADDPGADDLREAKAEDLHHRLDEGLTRDLLGEANAAYNTRPLDILLAALSGALTDWTGRDDAAIELETHGRDLPVADLDVSRTVGWLTAYFPISVGGINADDPDATLKTVKESYRRFSASAVSYGVARFAPDAVEGFEPWPTAELLFNYLGVLSDAASGSLLRPEPWQDRTARAGRNQRSHVFEINAYVDAGALTLVLTYSPARHRAETAQTFLQSFDTRLRGLVDHCMRHGTGGFTPSDFPEADLNQSELDDFLDALDEDDE